MSSKKKSESERQQDADVAIPEESERATFLQIEYDTISENLSSLKRQVEQLRRENEFLQNEVNQTRMENKEHISYLSEKAERKQNAIVTVSDQSHQELNELRRQSQNMQDEYKEQTNELKNKILQKENELTLLNMEIADLRESKTLQQQQLCRIAELERELAAIYCHNTESLVALKAGFLQEKKSYERQAADKLHAFSISAKREAPRYLMSHQKEVFQENQCLLETLKQLVPRADTLNRQHDLLQTQRRQLLLERENMQGLHCQRFPPHSQSIKPTGAKRKNTPKATTSNQQHEDQ
ncbi:interaptin-like [Myxocyprinus asiaticus]|uniref:interaptin-like n=1 Tax=Myxocyprinus asiaticus TaxID=70543 RepID=UPI0022222033|nr:interaptin-like [Myxocyprinus asiaticus]